ncbi:hypothetical protein ACS0TY_026036 [Phlomoides rotata]
MAVYFAVAGLHRRISKIIERVDVLLPPPSLKILEFFEKELKSFRNFVERLDSKSRERMSASLQGVFDTIKAYVDEDGSVIFGDLNIIVEGEQYEDLSRGIHSLVEQLKKVEKEYYTFQEDDQKEVVSSSRAVYTLYADLKNMFSRGIHSLVDQLKKVEKEYYTLQEDDHKEVVSSLSSSSRVVSKSKMVGLCDQRRRVKDDLILPWQDDIIFYAIFGMAGIGKTTLAREIFEDLDIIEFFECRVWVTAGFEWRPGRERTSEEITEDILAQVDPEAHKMVMGGSEEEKSEGLKESLKGKRYLIVLDHVWNQSVGEYLKSSFPDNQSKSRVVLTSRSKCVGLNYIGMSSIDMRLLDKEESWDLLQEKVFVGVSCPPLLEDAGKMIAEKCDGLPLTIVTIADLLSKVPESIWIDVATKRKHKLFVDAYDQISQVLNPSYEILLDEIKDNFLYMGAFPLKYEIPKSRLINLWIVEEFVEQKSAEKTLENQAGVKLRILAFSNLIMVYQKNIYSFLNSVSPYIKTCGLHSTWWHFCQTKARETNLFHVLDCYNENDIEKAIEGHTRLSIHNNVLLALKHVYNSIEEICASTARSLLCFGPYCQYMVPVCFGLKFLRRLDALNIRFYDFPLEVLELVKLRYLALTCNRNLPSSISNLRKLQYLIVHPHLSIKPCGALFNLPMEIWDMKRLKHLQVTGYDLPNLGETSLQELITLSDVTAGSCTVLNRVPNLTKLGIKIELAPDAAYPLYCFDHISHLTKLESLKCVIVNPEFKLGVVSPVFSFPCFSFSLKKLNLSGMGYPWKEMRNIASLPNLEVLKLRFNAFRGPEWEVEENGFPNLQALLVEDIDLVKLKWAHGSFNCLGILRIKHCYKLEELHLGNLPKIIEVEIVDCSPLTEWYVKNNALEYSYIRYLLVRSSWKL